VLYRLPDVVEGIANGRYILLVEGEKDVENLRLHGFVATCNAMGAGKWVKRYNEQLRDANVVILPDNDQPGHDHAAHVARQLVGVAQTVRVVELPGLAEKGDVSDWFAAGHTADELKELVRACPEWTAPAESPLPTATGNGHQEPDEPAEAVEDNRKVLDYTHKNLPSLAGDTWSAVLASPYADELYQRSKALIRVADGVEVLNEIGWRHIVSRCVKLVEQTKREGVRERYPDRTLLADTLYAIPPEVREVVRIANIPVLTPDGRLVDAPGYDTESKILYRPSVSVPEQMTLDEALSLICDDLLVDFPFDSGASRANAIALLLLPFVREMIAGPTPLHLVEAARPGTGKGKLLNLFACIWTGEDGNFTATPDGDENEWRKALTSQLLNAPEYVFFDNMRSLNSSSLELALTAPRWTDRILGRSKVGSEGRDTSLPVRCVWAATGNNVSILGDMPRRVVPIRLVSPYENPSEIPESAFKHSDLEGWVREHRGALIRACLTIVQQGLAAHIAGGVRIGSYERYCDVLGAVLAGVEVDGFLGNIARTRQNEDLSAWRQVVSLWWQAHGDAWVPAAEVWECIRGDDCPIYFKGDDATAQKRSMGSQLKKREGSVFSVGEDRYQIEKDADTSGRAVYRLMQISDTSVHARKQVSQVSQVVDGSLRVRACACAHAHVENIPKETCETCQTCSRHNHDWQLVIEAARADDLHTAWIDQACYLVNGRDEVLIDIAFGSEDEAIQAAQMKVSKP
jgi:hypothetical protein